MLRIRVLVKRAVFLAVVGLMVRAVGGDVWGYSECLWFA